MKALVFCFLFFALLSCDDERSMRSLFDAYRASQGESTCGAGMIKYEAGLWWECDAYNNWNQIEQPED